MVRLVFRPYTQVRKAICTSAHLRASTRVSSGFALLRHSSPSFGSQQVCSHSNLSQKLMVGRWCSFLGLPTKVRLLALHGFTTHQLAYMLDSLVRVSRRAGWKPSASILMTQFPKDRAPFTPWSVRRHRQGINPCFYPAQRTHADQHLAHTTPR